MSLEPIKAGELKVDQMFSFEDAAKTLVRKVFQVDPALYTVDVEGGTRLTYALWPTETVYVEAEEDAATIKDSLIVQADVVEASRIPIPTWFEFVADDGTLVESIGKCLAVSHSAGGKVDYFSAGYNGMERCVGTCRVRRIPNPIKQRGELEKQLEVCRTNRGLLIEQINVAEEQLAECERYDAEQRKRRDGS